MALALSRTVFRISRRNVFTTSRLLKDDDKDLPAFPDPIEHLTGLEKRVLLAEMAGNPDPFNAFARKRGPGTKDKPNEVPSAYEARIVGCICDEDQAHIKWMWVHKGEPKRCMCGNWFKYIHETSSQVVQVVSGKRSETH